MQSGKPNKYAILGAKLIKTPQNTPLNRRWNNLVNEFVNTENMEGLQKLFLNHKNFNKKS